MPTGPYADNSRHRVEDWAKLAGGQVACYALVLLVTCAVKAGAVPWLALSWVATLAGCHVGYLVLLKKRGPFTWSTAQPWLLGQLVLYGPVASTAAALLTGEVGFAVLVAAVPCLLALASIRGASTREVLGWTAGLCVAGLGAATLAASFSMHSLLGTMALAASGAAATLLRVGQLRNDHRLRMRYEAAEELAVDEARAKRQSEQAVQLYEQVSSDLEQNMEQQRTFFRGVVEELRGPATVVLNGLSGGARQHPPPEQLELARHSTRRMLHLIQQLSALQELQENGQSTKLGIVDTLTLAKSCTDYLKPGCAARDLDLQLYLDGQEASEISRGENAFVRADPEGLEKAIINILHAAVDRAPAHSQLQICLEPGDADLRIAITDHGTPVPEALRDRIFKPFSPLDGEGGGAGLDLAVSGELAEAMNARVGWEPAKGEKPACFYLELPRVEAPPVPIDVLAVAPDEQTRKRLADSLAGWGTVLTVATSEQAEQVMATQAVHCLLTDSNIEEEERTEPLQGLLDATPESCRRVVLVDASVEGQRNRTDLDRPVDAVVAYPWQDLTVTEKVRRMVTHEKALSIPPPAPPKLDTIQWALEGAAERSETSREHSGTSPRNSIVPPSLGPEKPAQRGKVLVVDNLRDLRVTLQNMLEGRGHEVITAASGSEALRLAEEQAPDLIVTDWSLPGMSCEDLLRSLRGAPATRSTPVVLITAKYDERVRALSAEMGADAYLGKPFQEEELASIVRNLLRVRKHQLDLEQAYTRLEKASDDERERSREMLLQREQLASLGRLVASVGHELSNPVGFLEMSSDQSIKLLERLSRKLDSTETADQDALLKLVQDMRDTMMTGRTAMRMLVDLSRALRNRARSQRTPRVAACLEEVIRESLLILKGKTRPFQLEVELSEHAPLMCQRSQVGQVITNLLANACDELGTVIAEARARNESRTGQMRLTTRESTREGRPGVELIVADNGRGVAEELRERIFELSFTTKGEGAGTGVGLSLCASIVASHEGSIAVSEDAQLGGACFTVWLPRQSDEQQPPVAEAS